MPLPNKARLPPGRLEKLFLSILALDIILWLVHNFAHWDAPGRDLVRLALYVAGLALLIKLLRAAVRSLLWRVRNRMIVLFLFIGLVPLLLITALIGLAGYMLIGQAAVYMATSELDRRADRLQDSATALAWALRTVPPDRRPAVATTFLEHAAESWPGLEALIREAATTTTFPPGQSLVPPHDSSRTLRKFVLRDGHFYLTAQASQIPNVEVFLLQPLGESYLAGLAPGLGRIVFWAAPRPDRSAPSDSPARRTSSRASAVSAGAEAVRQETRSAGSRTAVPAPVHRLDYEVIWGTSSLRIDGWGPNDRDLDVNLFIHTRPSAVYRLLFGQRVEAASLATTFFLIVASLFLIVELLSVMTGVSVTRTLTSSVHQLYEGTQKVNRGDFSHRIQIGGHDQLAELSRSFNSMTESIERLIEESKERQRLASELAIAREVQEQLFPKVPPVMQGLEVLGVCNAARMVSGDYFDFVKLSDDHLALAIGDVAGKGISGALLMASIQSMLRTQLSYARGAPASDGVVWRFPTADLVSQLNVQLYHNTSPEKYATFFFGAWDDRHGLLTYTNAGHLPPVLIRNGEPRRLDVNGMVVGAFPFAQYEQSEVEIHPGDLLVAFTDGITEPENDFAEEFGEPRLIELLIRHHRRSPQEIIDEVIAAVNQWTGRPELQDDMTMLVASRKS